MLYKYKIFLFVSLFFLISTPAFAELLLPLESGIVYEYSNSDNSGANWTTQIEVLEEVTLGSRKYYHIRARDFNQGDISDFNLRTTETEVYGWTGDGEELVFQIAPVGTKWSYIDWDDDDIVAEIIAIEAVTVPYGGPYTAYVHRKYSPSENSPYQYEYVVPGLGFIKAVDYWFDNPPMVMELTRIFRKPISLIPRYRLYNPNNYHHHYTIDANEYNVLETLGWIQEGTSCYFYNGYYVIDAAETVPYYRLYNPNSFEHHWTTDANEYSVLGTLGWIQEGADGYVFADQVSGSEPLYRLYNPNDGLHHWTMDTNERTVLIGYGFIDEGIACYVFP